MREKLAKLVALGTLVVVGVMVFLFAGHQRERMARMSDRLDPGEWEALYPLHYESYIRSARDDAGEPYDKLAGNPFRRRAWAGYAFELEHNASRAHYYAQIDQRDSRRTRERAQPAGCINCHAAEAPSLIEQYGWEGLHAMSYDEVKDQVHVGSSCLDCHDPTTMDLRISRPSFINAMRERGVDLDQASRQDMRSYVCAQCHVEYYFRGPGSELHLPWIRGLRLEDLEAFYDDTGFRDWRHPETGAAMIKMQHPDFELYSSGVHAAHDVACADCHMPKVREGGMHITEHWIRSPMSQLEEACLGCHRGSVADMARRVTRIQSNTRALLSNVEAALADLMDTIARAAQAGAGDAALTEARRAHRRAQLRWDFIDAENSVGFHAAHEATRILSEAVEIARAGQRSAGEALARTAEEPETGAGREQGAD